MKTKHLKPASEKSIKNNLGKGSTIEVLRLKYKFNILMGVLALAGLAITMRIDSPTVWTFLYGIAGWAALTNNSRDKRR